MAACPAGGPEKQTLGAGRGSRVPRGLLPVLLFACGIVRADETLHCGARIVALGQTPRAVQAACGDPSLVDRWPEAPPPFGRRPGPVEIWTFNFGPNRLLWLLRFDGERLGRIEPEGYGFVVTSERRCEPREIVAGMSKYRLLAYCGEPIAREARDVLEPQWSRMPGPRGLPADGYYRASYREEWTYNFGSARLMRKILIDNGRVVDVQGGERGFDIP